MSSFANAVSEARQAEEGTPPPAAEALDQLSQRRGGTEQIERREARITPASNLGQPSSDGVKT